MTDAIQATKVYPDASLAQELLARFRLAEKRDAPFAKLSRGMKRALTIAAALAYRQRP